MKISYQGQEWQLDLSDVDVRPMIIIQQHTGLTWRQWAAALEPDLEVDAEAKTATVTRLAADKPEFLTALIGAYWLMLRQAGEDVPIEQVHFPAGEFALAYLEAWSAEMRERAEAAQARPEPGDEGEPDPTPRPGDSGPSPEPTTPRPRKPRAAARAVSPDG